MKKLLIALLATAIECSAATTIEVSAKFADVPAGIEVPAKPDALEKMKSVNVLSAPKVISKPGEAATIEVTQDVPTPSGASVPLGITLSITPNVTPKGNISFTGKATDRFKSSQRDGEELTLATFIAREMFFKGWTPSGTTVLLKSSAPSASGKKEPSPKTGELVIYLTFKKLTTEIPSKKPSTAKSSSTTKSSTKKKSSKR